LKPHLQEQWVIPPKKNADFVAAMAETELGVLSRQCLDRRIPERDTLTREVAAWEASRNTAQSKVIWHFTTEDARIKLKTLYPSIQIG
jgi:hypothetical protein